MKNTSFIIKIGDLLQESGKSDSFSFSGAITTQIPHLTKEGISAQLNLQCLNSESLYATLEDVHCTIQESCESCGISFERKVYIPSYSARFVLSEELKTQEQETTDEEIFVLDARNSSINIEDMIAQAIILENPLVERCKDCEKRIAELPDDNDSYEEAMSSPDNIIFR